MGVDHSDQIVIFAGERKPWSQTLEGDHLFNNQGLPATINPIVKCLKRGVVEIA